MSMNKIADVQLETTAEYQDLSKLNVKFWNQDKNTAILKFNITRNNYPLSLSEENVKVFIALESGDSYLVDDDLDYLDELNGVVSYTIPNDFMRVATNVLGQVYVTTLDDEEVIVQRQFSFNVANDLIADLPSEEKIKEFKYFSDMREEVAKMLTKLNSDFENMNDYVSQVDQKTKDGINELNSLISQKEQAYNDNHTIKMKEITDKGNQYTNDFTAQREYIDTKYTDFQNAVQGSGLITTSQSSNWQKYRLTNNDGTLLKLDLNSSLDVLYAANIGSYYATGVPITGASSTAGLLTIEMNIPKNVKFITFRPFNSTQIWLKRFYTEWSSWEIVGVDPTKTETITGSQSKANVAESNAKTYAKDLVDKKTNVLFEGTANGVGTSINLNETLDNFIVVFVYGSTPGGSFVECADPQGTNDFVFEKTNVIGADGSQATVFECIIQKVSRTNLKIISDTYYGISSGTGSGANANRFTINKIVGVRK
ncbi:BppU family phage baseplate upper protein [Mammaliicoccus sciuri]|uniref:BppU family phage baseplate upper protein n=1 Tax=Mammaliicoccus sciuri TaxID=1296 RepID=UPI001950DCDE|nr:BppU family phage baseplate upper protein [Mammaliicoccus sciuri]